MIIKIDNIMMKS